MGIIKYRVLPFPNKGVPMKLKTLIIFFFLMAMFVIGGCQPKTDNMVNTADITQPSTAETTAPTTAPEKPVADKEKQIELTAVLSELEGEVIAKQVEDVDFSEVSNGFVLKSLGQVSTGFESRVRLDISDGSIVRLGANAVFTLDYGKAVEEETNTKLELDLGQIWIILKGGSIDVDTESGVASVRGSFLGISVSPTGEVYATCFEGDCYVATATGVIHFSAGETVLITGITIPPTTGYMTQAEIDEFMAINPEAQAAYALHLEQIASALPDDDFDGVPNEDDSCPDQGDVGFGVDETGCPNTPPPGDEDSDGVQNVDDECPFLGDLGFGVNSSGCPNPPADQDGDGYPDPVDKCPNQGDAGFGLDAWGCPRPNPDTDGDGVPNTEDNCPDRGDQGYGVDDVGCPYPPPPTAVDDDWDDDGIPNDEDKCPYQGPGEWGLTPGGCPKNPQPTCLEGDTDGDGVCNENDECPNQGDVYGYGVDEWGCPYYSPPVTQIP
jgi:hypothetical protein